MLKKNPISLEMKYKQPIIDFIPMFFILFASLFSCTKSADDTTKNVTSQNPDPVENFLRTEETVSSIYRATLYNVYTDPWYPPVPIHGNPHSDHGNPTP